jgi:hypothetical protein
MIHDILAKMLGKKRFTQGVYWQLNASKAEGNITCRHVLISTVCR